MQAGTCWFSRSIIIELNFGGPFALDLPAISIQHLIKSAPFTLLVADGHRLEVTAERKEQRARSKSWLERDCTAVRYSSSVAER